jgi:hypothetical protein
MDKLSSMSQILGTKTYKSYHVNIFKGVVFWPLASSVKVQKTNYCSQPTKLLESFVLSADSCSVKPS